MIKFFRGFLFAGQGLSFAFKTQVNLRFHFVAAVIVVGCGFLFNISPLEWLFIITSIALVISAELLNTAIEKLTDLVTQEMHPLAKIAKDCAAAAVLIVAIASIIIGCIIFLPKILALL